jgi:tRNA(fMet)-specific endonuclease VapC
VKYLLDTDHISCIQRRSGKDFQCLKSRMDRYSSQDFALSIISFHEQTLGAHTFINRAKNNAEILRGYTLLREILQGFSQSPVLPFDEKALLTKAGGRRQKAEFVTGIYTPLQGLFALKGEVLDPIVLIIFEQLQKKKVRIGTMDLKIASIALSRNLVLLTRNDRDFIKVPDLKIEDWIGEV